MSGLAAVLKGKRSGGVYRWHAKFDVAAVQAPVEKAGRTFAYLDGVQADKAANFHIQIASALGFPDYYGRNLDALADCLGDLTEPTVLLWDAWAVFADADSRVFRTVAELLAKRSDILTVLLRGNEPEEPFDIPSLD